jgi:fatty acid desaturase
MVNQPPPPVIPAPDPRLDGAETVGYVIAVIILVLVGAVLVTVVLNWISGPFIVIAAVALTTWVQRRRLER